MPETETNDVRAAKSVLAAKVAKVQGAISTTMKQRHVTVTLEKGGSYSYDYITEASLMTEIRPLLSAEGVAVYYSDEIKKLEGNLAAVRVTLTLVDATSGEERTMFAEGIGTDKGDKAVNKAKTAAMRYLLWKWFLVPSDIDPETENVERSKKPPRDQIKWATEADVQAFLEDVEASGFQRAPSQEAADKEYAEWEGWRHDWLEGQKRALNSAKAKAGKATTTEPERDESDGNPYP